MAVTDIGTRSVSDGPQVRIPSDRGARNPRPVHGALRRGRPYLFSGGIYLLISLSIWSRLWSSHPTSTTTSGYGDNSLVAWFLAWPAYAISHGLNPLYSTDLFYPKGLNMLSNVGMLGIGVPLAPVTWAFGPIATLNVALTLAPVLSALGMFVLLRRWVSWVPAAFIGGLLYGFSPFVLSSLTLSHLMLGLVAIPPLIAAALDELLIRQRARPIRVGVLLGVLVALEFFISTEVLVLTLIAAGVAFILVVGYAALYRPAVLRDHAHYAVVGLSAGVVTAVALLGYFVWFALAGPAHLSGPIWPSSHLAQSGSNLAYFFTPAGIVHPSPAHIGVELLNGYSGTNFSPQYFGVGLFAVAVGGVIVWRRDRRLLLFAAIGVVSIVLSLGASKNTLLPWQLMANLPEFENVIPGRFVLIIFLCLAVMLGLIVDHTYGVVCRWSDAKQESNQDLSVSGKPQRRSTFSGLLAAALVATIALLPIASYLAQAVPVAAQPVVLPQWFRTAAPRLSAGQVLLVLPMPGLIESPLTWQVVGGMHYATVDGAGPESVLSRAGSERKGQAVIAEDSTTYGVDLIGPNDVAAVRRSLDEWGVTMVVISAQAPSVFEQVTSVPFSVALMTAATGQRPIEQLGDWVWSGVRHSPRALALPTASANRCVKGAVSSISSIERMVSCIFGDAEVQGHRGAQGDQ